MLLHLQIANFISRREMSLFRRRNRVERRTSIERRYFDVERTSKLRRSTSRRHFDSSRKITSFIVEAFNLNSKKTIVKLNR